MESPLSACKLMIFALLPFVFASNRSIILSTKEVGQYLTTSEILKNSQLYAGDLFLIVSTDGSSTDGIDRKFPKNLNLKHRKVVEENCTLLNLEVEKLAWGGKLKLLRTGDSLGIINSGIFLYESDFSESAVQSLSSLAERVSDSRQVFFIITDCPPIPFYGITTVPTKREFVGIIDVHKHVLVLITPVILQQLIVFLLFLFVLVVAMLWMTDVKIPICLLKPEKPTSAGQWSSGEYDM